MSDTWSGASSTNWFTSSNWGTLGVPVISATGTQSVVINAGATEPVISPNAAGATQINVAETLNTNGVNYTVLSETQIGGEFITLTNGANLDIQGIAMGIFYGNKDTLTAANATMTGLHGALTATPTADMHMQISAIGNTTLTVDTVNENFGFITIGNADTLTINNIETGGNAQQLHGLINYGEISISTGGELIINAQSAANSTYANFYNAGWIVDNGGTLSITSSVLDGASTLAGAGSIDGFIELGNSANAILDGTVASTEQVDFTDSSASTLQITAGTLFSGTVNNFGPNDTIIVQGFTSTSNATITTVGGVTELVTANGTVMTTITLTGTTSSNITTETIGGQEYIISGGTSTGSNVIYSGGTHTLGSLGSVTPNDGTIAVTGGGTLAVNSSLSGNGTIYIDYGSTAGLYNTTGNDSGQTVQFGTHGSTTGFNTLILNDNSAGFGGTVIGFGVNDDIVLGASVLTEPTTGSGALLSYNSTTDVLTVKDTNSTTGSVISSTSFTITGTAAGALSTASFIELNSTAGTVIELASNLTSQGFDFSITSGTTGGFETPANFTGGTAPGDSLVAGETATIASGTASITSSGVTDNGTIAVLSGAGFLDNGSLTGTGTLAVAAGGSATLGGSVSLGAILDSGSVTLTGSAPVSSINMEGNGANTVADFTGSATAPLTNFGTTDDIILGNGALATPAAGDGLVLSYNTGSSVLTVTETNSSGSVIGTENITVTGTAAGALSTSSFVALESSKGINIELAPTAAASYTFSVSSTGGFETPANFTGGVAPGDILSANETVTISAGTASVSSGGVTDAGMITIASAATFLDNGSLTGTGALNVAAGGFASLNGYTSLATVTDIAGTLDLAGSVASVVSLTATGSQLYVTGNLTDSALVRGVSGGGNNRGTITVESGATANFAGGVTAATVLDLGTLEIGAAAKFTTINMENNGANSAVEFTAMGGTAPLTSFGTGDKIILTSGALQALPTGDGYKLAYTGGVLTVSETVVSTGVAVAGASAAITVGVTTGDTAAFEVLNDANGIAIELTSGVATQGFDFSIASGTSGAFESGANFTGGVAPGDTLATGESVTIGSGTASVSGAGVTDAGNITVNSGAGFLDTGTLTGAGTLTVLAGGSATIAAGSSQASVLDHGTLNLAGSMGGSINMEGNGANSVVDFTGTSTAAPLTNLGTSDEIILGTNALTAPVVGTSAVYLSYNTATGVLTVEDTNSSSHALIGTADSVTVSGTAAGALSTASFIALASTKGEVIELTSSLPAQGFNFSASGTGSFETPANFTGGIAPGDTLVAGETVTIAAGTASVSSTGVADAGVITVSSGATFLDAGTLTGTGTLTVGTGGTATIAGGSSLGSILDSGTINLTGAAAASSINMENNGANSVVDFTGTSTATPLTNFGTSDKIIIGGSALHLNALTDTLTESYNTGTGVLTITDHTNGSIASVTVGLGTGDTSSEFKLSTSAAGVTVTLCFYPGTALATPTGEVKVEDIKAGDLLMTTDGAKPVRWIGQSHIHTGFADPLRSLPIRIRQGALGGGLPMRDLLLSPDHAVHIDDILVQVSALVNGTSIIRDHNVPEQFTYYHVELDSHVLLLAEGVEAESFVDNVDRMNFHNWNDRETPSTPIQEMDLPRAKSARQVPESIRRQIGITSAAVA